MSASSLDAVGEGAGRGIDRAVRCSILGPFRMTAADGSDLTPAGTLQRRLAAALVLHRGRVLSIDSLADTLWPDRLPADHEAAVQTHVFRLRRRVPDLAIDHQPPGYRLSTESVIVDADEFEAAIAAASVVGSEGPADALARLDAALTTWRGQPFDELAGDDAADIETRRLVELHHRAIESRFELMIELGHARDAVADVESHAARNPLRDHACELLLRALEACGRRGEALRAYDRHRRLLADELGIEPSPGLRALHHAILDGNTAVSRGGAVLRGGPTGPHVDPRSVGATVAQPFLPTDWVHEPVVKLVGRSGVSAALDEALASARVVTLLGTGGVGKTSLAAEAVRRTADRFSGGAAVFELAGSTNGSVAADVLAAAGLEPRAGVTAGARLASVLGGRRVLVVFDNCEHVLDDVAPLVEHLVVAAPDVTVLTTSRERLSVPGERLVPVPPLNWTTENEIAPAVALFAERAAAVAPGFRLDDSTVEVVSEICRQVGGLPLAIELAANRLHALDLDEVAAGLRSSHVLLSGGRRTVARHRSMAAAVQWSLDLLDDAHRDGLLALSVFASSFDLAAASAVVGTPLDETRACLAGLADRSLVQRTGDRWTLLEPIRQHAEALMAGADEHEASRRQPRSDVRDRHARHILDVAEEIAADARTDRASEAVARTRTVIPEARSAVRWSIESGQLDVAVRILLGIHATAFHAMIPEPLTWADDLAAAAVEADHPACSPALGLVALAAWKAGDVAGAQAALQRAAVEAARLGTEEHWVARDVRGTTHAARGHLDEAVAEYQRALAAPGASSDPIWRSETSATLLAARSYRRDPDVVEAADRLVTDLIPHGCPIGAAWCWYGAGEAVLHLDPIIARERLQRAVSVARSAGVTFIEGVAGASLASLEVRHGPARSAVAHYRWLLPLIHRGGAIAPFWTSLRSVTDLLTRNGFDADAAVLLGAVTGPGAQRAFGDDEERLDQIRDTLTLRLGPRAFADLTTEGAALGDAGALAYALETFEQLDS